MSWYPIFGCSFKSWLLSCSWRLLHYLAFQSVDYERTWWRLFWAYLMKAILSVPDEGYSERTWWRLFWAYLMKVILSVPDEGYSERTWWRLFWAYLMKAILSVPDEGYSERTWWRLFQKLAMYTKFDIYLFFVLLLFKRRKQPQTCFRLMLVQTLVAIITFSFCEC
jgi:hypothetical protein